MSKELKWLKNPVNTPYVLLALLLVFVVTILGLGRVISEKMGGFYS